MCLISHLWAGTDSEPLVRQDMTAPGGEEYQYQDRRQEIVFIGQRMKRKVIQELLDSCLLTEEEMALGPDRWLETMGHLDTIQLQLPGPEDEEDEDEEDEMEVDSNEGHQSEECRKACEEKQKLIDGMKEVVVE